jgi:hypothetical protein
LSIEVDVFVALELVQAFAEFIDVGASRYGKVRIQSKEGGAAHRSGVGLGAHGFDIHTEGAERARDLVDDAGLIHAADPQIVWNKEL